MMDKEMIEAGVELYYDSLHESSAEKVHEAFHANARITGYLHGDFMDMSVDQICRLCGLSTTLSGRKQCRKSLEHYLM